MRLWLSYRVVYIFKSMVKFGGASVHMADIVGAVDHYSANGKTFKNNFAATDLVLSLDRSEYYLYQISELTERFHYKLCRPWDPV